MLPLAVSGLRAAQLQGALSMAGLAATQSQRNVYTVARAGRGGRSSVCGITVTVFGATGFLGRYLVNQLGQKGTQMVIPIRGDELHFRHLRQMCDVGQIFFPEYNVRDYDSIKQAVKYADVVFNMAGRDYATRNFSLTDIHVDAARSIAKACREEGVERLIHVSALGASASSPSAYLKSKYDGEVAVRKEFPSATIVRPAKVFGPEDRLFKYMAVRNYIFPFFIPTARKAAVKWPVYCSDIGKALANCVDDMKAPGTTYEFIGPKPYTNEEIIRYFQRITHHPGMVVQLPRPIFKWMAYWAGMLREPFLHPELAVLEALDEVVTGLPGIPDLGVELTPLPKVGVFLLRGYRPHHCVDEPISEEDARATA